MPDVELLWHQHSGKVYSFKKSNEELLAGIRYEKWRCSGPCTAHLLVRKKNQRIVSKDGDVTQAYGFSVGEVVAQKKTGRRAMIVKFEPEYTWRTRKDGGRQRVQKYDSWQFTYQWLDPAKPGGKIMSQVYLITKDNFFHRFQKTEES